MSPADQAAMDARWRTFLAAETQHREHVPPANIFLQHKADAAKLPLLRVLVMRIRKLEKALLVAPADCIDTDVEGIHPDVTEGTPNTSK